MSALNDIQLNGAVNQELQLFNDGINKWILVLIVLHRCAYHKGAIGPGETEELECDQSIFGRFVFVMLKVKEYLTLCEVEVLAVAGILTFPSKVCC